MKKKTLSLLLVFVMSLILIGNVFAAPRWSTIIECDPTLTFNGSTAGCTMEVTGKSGTSKIVATMELQVKNSSGNYVRSASWSTQTVNGDHLLYTQYAYNRPAGEYRLIINATVYNSSGVGESAYSETYATCRG